MDSMTLPLKTPGIHHIGLRCGDLEKALHFYGTVLGFKIIRPAPVLIFLAGATVIAMKGPEKDSPPGDRFNPHRIGLDHLALGCEDVAELHSLATALTAAGVEHTGVKADEQMNGRLYLSFKDPDRISWEFYSTK